MVSPSPDPARCKLDMDVDLDKDDPPSVQSLMQEVARLQQVVRDISPDDDSVFVAEWLPPQYGQKTRTASGGSDSFSPLGICSRTRVATLVGNLSPHQNVGVMVRSGEFDSSVNRLRTPPTKRRERPAVSPAVPRPIRVASLTKENISLLPTPRAPTFAGSVCGSQQSRVSIRTEGGGTVYSRLYQPDFYKKREEKFQTMRDRRESFHCSFTPRTNRRDSISSRDSVDTESQASMQSAKTDVMNVSSRLYDPNYARKRNARLQRMRQKREMRECTFTPVINGKKSAPLH